MSPWPTKNDQGRKVEVTFKDGTMSVGIMVIHRVFLGSDIWYVYTRDGGQHILISLKEWKYLDE